MDLKVTEQPRKESQLSSRQMFMGDLQTVRLYPYCPRRPIPMLPDAKAKCFEHLRATFRQLCASDPRLLPKRKLLGVGGVVGQEHPPIPMSLARENRHGRHARAAFVSLATQLLEAVLRRPAMRHEDQGLPGMPSQELSHGRHTALDHLFVQLEEAPAIARVLKIKDLQSVLALLRSYA